MDQIPPEIAARISALEVKVAELYRHLDFVEPASADAVAASLPDDIVALARAGKREEAIRVAIVQLGVSTVDASAMVNGYLRSIGH